MRIGVVGGYGESVVVAALKRQLQAVVARGTLAEIFANAAETRQGRSSRPHGETQIAAIYWREARSTRNRIRQSEARGVRRSVYRVKRIGHIHVIDYLRQMASELAHVSNGDHVGARLLLQLHVELVHIGCAEIQRHVVRQRKV